MKPDISTLTENSEFHRALKQMASVKKLKRQIQFMPTGYIPPDHSIPSIIFSNKSRSLNDMTNYMIQQVDKGVLKSADLPDIILTFGASIQFTVSKPKTAKNQTAIANSMNETLNDIKIIDRSTFIKFLDLLSMDFLDN